MKRFFAVVIFLLVLALLITSPAFSQDRKPDAGSVKVDKKKYDLPAVQVAGDIIKPGMKLPEIWGLLGPPDKIWAMRSKNDVKKDYVKMDYFTYGMSVDVNNNTNDVQGILVEENNPQVKLINCPFKIGQERASVTAAWGQPDSVVNNIQNYWRRGVYVGVGQDGKISYMFLSFPGEYKDEKK